MYRRYAEIVHYRAPYRDQLVGCGQTVSDAATSEIGRRGYVEKGADGISRLRANYAQDFLQLLSSGFEVVMQGDNGYVTKKDPLLGTTLIPCPTATLGGASQPMGDAQAWVKSQLED